MHAVGINILNKQPDSRVLYCTGEDFTNEIVHAIQTKKSMVFKEKFRTVDILLIDDVQFIAGKNTVQEEFFHTFNSITKRAGQIILTSDRPPAEISLLEDRLRSRFEAGLMVDIQQPSFELRTAILLIKATASHLTLPMELAQIIATRIDSARKLEGIIKSIKSEVELKHRTISPELIDELCKIDAEKPQQRLRVKPGDVIKTVADFYQLKQSALRGQVRVKSIVKARHVAMYFLKEDLHLPYMEVGRWFSNRDHTSALHALRKISSELQSDNELRQEMQTIRVQLEKISK
jgi:chromosomal replication initiator protein